MCYINISRSSICWCLWWWYYFNRSRATARPPDGYSLFFSVLSWSQFFLLSLSSLCCVCVYIIHTKGRGLLCISARAGPCTVKPCATSPTDGRAARAHQRRPPSPLVHKKGGNHVTDIKGFTYTAAAQRVRLFYIIHREWEIEVSSLCLLQLQCHGIIRGAKDGQPPFSYSLPSHIASQKRV
jgi:hypothetical protein